MTRIAPLPSWIIAIALTGCLQLAQAQNPASAYVPLAVVGAKIGFTTNFTCQSHGIPISNCLWERVAAPGSSAGAFFLNVNTGNARPGENIQPGYSYLGDGLEKGECGVAIQTVKEGDNGKWKCTLITNSGLYIGEVDLGILKKPDQPKFDPPALAGLVDSDDNRFRTSQPSKITCYSGNGQPQPRFQWFIGEEPLREGLNKIGYVVPNNSDVGYTFQELHNHKFTWKDNGKKLRCVAIHDAFGPDDPKEAQVEINIQFPPRPTGDDGRQVNVRAEIGTEKILSVNISANPRPTQVVWNVDKKPIREGENVEGKYDAMIIKEVEPGVWEASLRIRSVEEEDVNKHFFLKVSNDYGEADFDLKVASEATGSGGLSAGGIVLLILGIAALLIIIALVVVYARAQGLLCFKGDDGTASEKERMDGGSTGPGSGEEPPQQKPGLKLTSRLSALYDNLLNKKKDKPVPADEETATATKEKEPGQESSTPVKPGQAPGTPATGVDSKDPAKPDDEKKSEDIVYAELDLARSGVGGGGGNGNPEIVVRASDDKTEYAEIVGVVAASTIDEHKRSPSASNKSGSSTTDK